MLTKRSGVCIIVNRKRGKNQHLPRKVAIVTQYLSDEIGIEYGIKKTWRVALVAPDGEILYSKGLGYYSCVDAQSVAYHSIQKWLIANPEWSGSSLVSRNISQMLGLDGLKEWHCFRLAWGNNDPNESYADAPNGRDLEWKFYFCANGRNQVLLTGSLPAEWWEWDDSHRYHYIQNVME